MPLVFEFLKHNAVALLALVVAVLAYRKNAKEHGWREADRAREEERREWCLNVCRHVRLVSTGVTVGDDRREWVLWGEANGYFVTHVRSDGTLEARLTAPVSETPVFKAG